MLKKIILSGFLLANGMLFASTLEYLEAPHPDDNTVAFSTTSIPNGALVKVICTLSIKKNRDESYFYILSKTKHFGKIAWFDNKKYKLRERGSKISLPAESNYLNGKNVEYYVIYAVSNLNEALVFDLSHAPAIDRNIKCDF
ncbi:MAG: hypothetical protein NXI01_04800 [Gammaproteobacteria bacterium]|nr:hypothetical protein [Gammaproteobacteria bacterium]